MFYDYGDTVAEMWGTVRDASGTPTNAATVILEIELPDGTVATPAVTNPPAQTGVYGLDYVPPIADGDYKWHLGSTSPTTALSGEFHVLPRFPRHIISLKEARAQLNQLSTDTVDDEEIRSWLEALTIEIEDYKGQVIARRPVTERISASYASTLYLVHRPIISVTSIATTDGATTWPVTSSDIDIDADAGVIYRLSGSPWHGSLMIELMAGKTSVPANERKAALFELQSLWRAQRGTMGSPLAAGTLLDNPPDPGAMSSQLSPAARRLLGPRPPMVA